jgi:hypothetical protein
MLITNGEPSEKINPFISSLSVLNFLFALTMNVFGYTIFYLLEKSNISLIYGGLGTSIGQLILLFILIPQGRFIDKGKSYTLMILGALVYGFMIVLIFIDSLNIMLYSGVIMAAGIGIVLVSQNTFKSSLSSFIGKAIKLSLVGRNYSRIILMEMLGGTAAMFTVAAAVVFSTFRIIYLISGVFLLIATLAAFFILFPENRKMVLESERKTKRPGFMESVHALSSKKRFVVPLLLTKIFMAIGVYVVSYFFIISGQKIDISPVYAIIALGIGFALSVPFGLYGEKFVDAHPNVGKAYVVVIALLDLGMYSFLAAAFFLSQPVLFYLSLGFSAPGPVFVAGGMTYELKIIGKENRGMFTAIQRTLVGITYILIGIPFAFIFTVDFRLIWYVLLVLSVGTLLFSLLLPSGEYVRKHFSLPEE